MTTTPEPLDVLTLGETMALLVAQEPGPLEQVQTFSKRLAGADSNVAALAFVKAGAQIPPRSLAVGSPAKVLRERDYDTGKVIVPGIFAAVPYCIDLIGGPYIETRDEVVKAFRPKSAIKLNV